MKAETKQNLQRAMSVASGLVTGVLALFTGAYRLAILALVAAIVIGSWLILDKIEKGGQAITNMLPTIPGKAQVPEDIPRAANAAQFKCIAYTGLADWAGASVRVQIDLERIMRAVYRINDLYGIDECEIFHRQTELVPPGWGQRYYTTRIRGRQNEVQDRVFAYIETEFREDQRLIALKIAEEVIKKPDPKFRAVTIIRPDRKVLMGMMDSNANQKPEELAKIQDPNGPLVEFKPEGPPGSGEFKWFRMKVEPEKPKQ